MRRPAEDDLRTGFRLVFLDGDQVREGLAGMDRGGLEADDRPAGIVDELLQDGFRIVVGIVLQPREGADADQVAVAPDDRDRLAQVLRLVPVHHHAEAGFQLPALLADVQHDRVQAEVQGGLLAAQARPETAVEENEDDGPVDTEMCPAVRVGLDGRRLGEGFLQVPDIADVEE